jgi:hypothetical protein
VNTGDFSPANPIFWPCCVGVSVNSTCRFGCAIALCIISPETTGCQTPSTINCLQVVHGWVGTAFAALAIDWNSPTYSIIALISAGPVVSPDKVIPMRVLARPRRCGRALD